MSSTQASSSIICWRCWVFLLITATVLGFYAGSSASPLITLIFHSDSPLLALLLILPLKFRCAADPLLLLGMVSLIHPPLRLYTKSSPNPYCLSALFAYLQIQMPNGPPIDISNSTPLFRLKGLRIHSQAPNSSPF